MMERLLLVEKNLNTLIRAKEEEQASRRREMVRMQYSGPDPDQMRPLAAEIRHSRLELRDLNLLYLNTLPPLYSMGEDRSYTLTNNENPQSSQKSEDRDRLSPVLHRMQFLERKQTDLRSGLKLNIEAGADHDDTKPTRQEIRRNRSDLKGLNIMYKELLDKAFNSFPR